MITSVYCVWHNWVWPNVSTYPSGGDMWRVGPIRVQAIPKAKR